MTVSKRRYQNKLSRLLESLLLGMRQQLTQNIRHNVHGGAIRDGDHGPLEVNGFITLAC